MPQEDALHQILQRLTILNVATIIGIIAAARLLAFAIRKVFTLSAEKSTPLWRIRILRWMPLARLLVVLAAAGFIVAIVMVPSWRNVLGLFAGTALVFAFAMKDYGSCLLAGLVTIFERVYQPGDWIEIDGAYGEVTSIGLRAVHLVTLDDTEVIIPHSKIWDSPVFNSTSSQHTVLCVADFYLHPEHDGLLVRDKLIELATGSPLRLADSAVKVTAAEKPWGTHYRLKAYAKDSRQQKQLTTDLTLRSKDIFRTLGIRPANAPATVTA